MFDPVQAPSLRDAFELVKTAIPKTDFGLRHQILHRARDQDFAGTCFRGDARADVKRQTDQLRPAHFVFTRVQPYPDLQPQRAHRLVDCSRATDPGSRCDERRQQSVPRRHDFLSAQSLQLSTDGCVIVIHHLRPTGVAELCCFFGGPNDIDKQDRGERLLKVGATLSVSTPGRNTTPQRFIAMVASSRDCGLCIVLGTLHRTAANSFFPRWKRPVNLSSISGAMNFRGAPLQENRRTNPSNTPCLGGVSGNVRLMDSDAKELRHDRAADQRTVWAYLG